MSFETEESSEESAGDNFTGDIHAWFEFPGQQPENSFLLHRVLWDESRDIALSKDNNIEAGEALHSWFLDRMTVDPGVPGPFGDLAFNLISSALSQVDWEDVAARFRARYAG